MLALGNYGNLPNLGALQSIGGGGISPGGTLGGQSPIARPVVPVRPLPSPVGGAPVSGPYPVQGAPQRINNPIGVSGPYGVTPSAPVANPIGPAQPTANSYAMPGNIPGNMGNLQNLLALRSIMQPQAMSY